MSTSIHDLQRLCCVMPNIYHILVCEHTHVPMISNIPPYNGQPWMEGPIDIVDTRFWDIEMADTFGDVTAAHNR